MPRVRHFPRRSAATASRLPPLLCCLLAVALGAGSDVLGVSSQALQTWTAMSEQALRGGSSLVARTANRRDSWHHDLDGSGGGKDEAGDGHHSGRSEWDVCPGEFGGVRIAWITFASTDSYLPGVYALYGSLRRQRPAFEAEGGEDFVALLTCGVSAEAAASLCGVGMRVLRVCEEENGDDEDNRGETVDGRRQQAVSRRLPKLNIFRVACLYDRIVYVDADMVFLKDPGALLMAGPRRVFRAAEGQVRGRFNSGLFVHDCDGGATWAAMEQAIAGLGDCVDDSCKYWDRMSKRVADQGFLNGFFDGEWEKLGQQPYQYNAKLLFYIKGQWWGVSSRPVSLDRSQVVALHWIGDHKPWQPTTNFPCGNTKKYCFCIKGERLRYEAMLSWWWDDYQIGKSPLGSNIKAELRPGRHSTRLALPSWNTTVDAALATHDLSQPSICAEEAATRARQSGERRSRGSIRGRISVRAKRRAGLAD